MAGLKRVILAAQEKKIASPVRATGTPIQKKTNDILLSNRGFIAQATSESAMGFRSSIL